MNDFSNQLFLLITNLSQLKDKARVISLFIDGINSIAPLANLCWVDEATSKLSLFVCTRKKNYGYVMYSDHLVSRNKNDVEFFMLLQNAVQMLAVILEKIEQGQLLSNQKDHLELLVEEQTVELKHTNNKLREEIDQHFLTERKLQKSQTSYRGIFNGTRDAIFIHDADTGKILDVNQAMLEMYKCNYPQALRLTVGDISANDAIYNTYSARKKIHNTTISGKELFEWKARRIDGKLFWVEISLSLAEINGNQRVLAVVRNINERKKTENELNQYRKNLKKLVDKQTYELRQTAEELTATNEELYLKNNIAETQKLEIEQLNEEMAQYNEELVSSNEALLRKRDELEEILAKLKNTQTHLIHSEKMASLGILTAGIAHEINNPVNFINSGVHGLEMLYSDVIAALQKYREMCKIKCGMEEYLKIEAEIDSENLSVAINELITNIKTGVQRTVEIVKSLSLFSHSKDLTSRPIDIHNNIDSSLIMLRNQYKNRIEIIKDYGDVPLIECYQGKINQVFMNIISNAIQSIDDNGTITISTKMIDSEIISISIKDNGSGMSEDTLSHIFDPFYTTKKIGVGTGLGLSIVYNIIEQHNGSINVVTEIGKGSEFILTLPCKIDAQ